MDFATFLAIVQMYDHNRDVFVEVNGKRLKIERIQPGWVKSNRGFVDSDIIIYVGDEVDPDYFCLEGKK